jgi:hypothetical protein
MDVLCGCTDDETQTLSGLKKMIQRLKTPLFRLRDWMGKTSTSEILSPTVNPTETEMSCRATWNPVWYNEDEGLPDAC